MTSEELFTLLASPTARVALVAALARAAANDDERPVDRACERCGRHFDAGTFTILGGRVTTITCTHCEPFG